jgi:hypothetical protein
MYTQEQGTHHDSFNFEEWAALASQDPDAFEQRRKDYIETFISTQPSSKQRKLRGLQFKIDMERRRARTPMGACIKLSSMMWDSLLGPEGLMNSLQQLTKPWPHSSSTAAARMSAQVISFHKNN